MHWKWFYNKNALEMNSLQKYIENDFALKILWKLFYYKKVMEIILLYKMQ